MPKRKTKKHFLYSDRQALVAFYNGLLEKAVNTIHHLDIQANILIGISSAIFLFSFSKITDGSIAQFPYLVLGLFSGFSSVVGLYAVHPPRYMRKVGQKESLLYSEHVLEYRSGADYRTALEQATIDEKGLSQQYTLEIHNLYHYYQQPKRRLFNISRRVLFVGMALTLLAFIFTGQW